MLVKVITSELEWEEVHHSTIFGARGNFSNLYHAEVYHYKNEDLSVSVGFKIFEHENNEKPFEVTTDSYIHVVPTKIKLDLNLHKVIGEYATLEEAKESAQNYFNHHHYQKGHQ